MRKILLIIDMQDDFINGILGSKAAQSIVPKICNKIKNFKDNDIIYTIDTHYEDFYNETIEGQKIPKHCIVETDGYYLNEDVAQALENYVCEKPDKRAMSGITKYTFGSVNFLVEYIFELIKKYKCPYNEVEIEIVGLCTDICVVSNALILRSAFPKTRIIVDSKCCAGSTLENHKAALKIMEANCIDII